MVESLLQQLVIALGDIEHLKAYVAATMGIYLWVWVTGLPREIRLLWRGQRSLTKILVIINRHYTILAGIVACVLLNAKIPPHVCRRGHLYLFTPISYIIILGICDWILAIRTYVVFGCNKKLGILLGVSYIAVMVNMIVATATNAFYVVDSQDFPGFTGCIVGTYKPKIFMFWAPMLCFDFINLVLHVVIAWRTRHLQNTKIMRAFRYQGLLYFLAILAVHLVNIFFYGLARKSLTGINAPFAVAFTSIVASNFVLDLLQLAKNYDGDRLLMTEGMSAISGMESGDDAERVTAADAQEYLHPLGRSQGHTGSTEGKSASEQKSSSPSNPQRHRFTSKQNSFFTRSAIPKQLELVIAVEREVVRFKD